MNHHILCAAIACLLVSIVAVGQSSGPVRDRAITVITEPEARVWVAGVLYGTTDDTGRLKITSVPSGIRIVKIRKKGFSEATKSLAATTRGDVSVKLVRTSDEAELAFQSAEAMTTVDREKAIAEYQRALKLRPGYVDCYIGLARAYSERGEIENAFAAIKNAKRVKPGNAEISAIEGRLLKDSGEEDKAIAAFKRSIAEGRGFQPEAYTGLGLLYKDRAENAGGSGEFALESSNYDEAEKNLVIATRQLGSAPDAIVVTQLLGLIYEKQKHYQQAIALYQEFLRIFPDAVEAEAVRSFIVQIRKQMAEQP